MSVHISYASFSKAKGQSPETALAVVTAPGLCDVIAFITFNDKGIPELYTGEVWNYQLSIHSAVLVQSGCASFDI